MPSPKYAVVERERRFLLRSLPDGVSRVSTIVDRYVEDTRLRLREVTDEEGHVVRKLGHKVRLGDGPAEVACTSLLPGRRRVDEFEDGSLVAEIDDGAGPSTPVPEWLDVAADVSADESWTGASVAAHGPPLTRGRTMSR